jgi:hypothetical protein
MKFPMNKIVVQADQGFKMNLINTTFIYDYHLIIYSLFKTSFFNLTIRYANNCEILIYHFINLKVDVKGI